MQDVSVGCRLRLRERASWDNSHVKGGDPLPLFAVGNIAIDHTAHVFTEIETEAEMVLGSFRPKEYHALCTANIPNNGCLNWVLGQMGVQYAPRPLPGSKVS
jgi:hypothetical protein